MGLHEGIVISLADGYYRTSGKPGFVNIHVIAGTAQAAGQMYNASKDGSALVVIAAGGGGRDIGSGGKRSGDEFAAFSLD